MVTKAAVGLVLAALLVFGCGESESEKAMADVCSARDDIATHVDHLKGLSLTTATGDDVRSSLQSIRNDLSKIRDARGKLADEQRDAVEAANDSFTETVRGLISDVGSSVSVADASTQLKSALQKLGSSYESTFGQLDCS
jgi:hypothetical protein